MKTFSRDSHPGAGLAALILSACFVWPSGAIGAESLGTNTIIPLVVMDNVPLDDAIRNLARMAKINFILDPRVSSGDPITGRWENTTAGQVLELVLTNHQLVMVANPATSVSRIAPAKENVKPIPGAGLANDTSGALPVITMDQVPVDQVILKLAAQAQLKVVIDVPPAELSRIPEVSFRWENLTARQALAALVDNYNLVMIPDSTPGSFRITVKKEEKAKEAPK
jgi:type II secretory pathway component GspD/PulD (secretin)